MQGASGGVSLPHDTVGKIIRELSFQDKCSLELAGREFHDLLGSPSPSEKLWGTCDLMSDLKVAENVDSAGDIMRWLTKRLPGFTKLICNATSAHQSADSHLCDAKSAATWLVAQLPKLCSASTSTFKLHLILESDLATRLLRSNTSLQRVQDTFWSALSENLTELCFIMDPHEHEPMRLDVLTQLINLTSLKFNMVEDSNGDMEEVATSYVLNLLGLKSLHMRLIHANNLTLLCPELRSLTIDLLRLEGDFSLPASLENLSPDGISTFPLHEASALIALRGLTSLTCHVPYSIKQDLLYGALPSMSVLRSLSLILVDAQLPPLLPSSLREINYYLLTNTPLSSWDLQHFARACQLPQLQSVGLYNRHIWTSDEKQALDIIQAESGIKVSVVEDWKDRQKIVYRMPFPVY